LTGRDTRVVDELVGELEERFTIVIVTDRLPQRAADAAALMPDGEYVEHVPTTGMFADPDEYVECDVSGRFG
jgi:ABC-type phosphate transport system ATPase subunit